MPHSFMGQIHFTGYHDSQMMCPSNLNPQLSAYTVLNGMYDYMAHPMAPPGCQVIVHEKTSQRGTWEKHGEDGWYLKPAMEHYRCYKTYIPKMGREDIRYC